MIPIGTGDRRRLQAEQARAADRQRREDNLLIFKHAIHKGRPNGKPAGTWIDDIAAQQNGVILCHHCKPKFTGPTDKPPTGFVYDRWLRVSGRCDGCRTDDWQGNHHFFIHEKLIGVSHQLAVDKRAEELERRIQAMERHFPSIARELRRRA